MLLLKFFYGSYGNFGSLVVRKAEFPRRNAAEGYAFNVISDSSLQA